MSILSSKNEFNGTILPDNSITDCNLFVKGLDTCFDSQDLYDMFKKYGEIKSAKLSLVPDTHQSKGYGFIWFNSENATQKAITDSSKGSLPILCTLYKPKSLSTMTTSSSKCVIVKHFPSNFLESDLRPFFEGFG